MTTEQRKQFEAKARLKGYTDFTMRSAHYYAHSDLNILAQGYMLAL